MPYQRKYSRPYHTWLGCPHWPFYLSHMSWIPDLITRLLPSPLYCFIAILLSRDHVRYLQAPAQWAAAPTVHALKVKSYLFHLSFGGVGLQANKINKRNFRVHWQCSTEVTWQRRHRCVLHPQLISSLWYDLAWKVRARQRNTRYRTGTSNTVRQEPIQPWFTMNLCWIITCLLTSFSLML